MLFLFIIFLVFALVHADNDHARLASRVFVSTLLNYGNDEMNPHNSLTMGRKVGYRHINLNPPRPPHRREDDVRTNVRPSRFGRVNGISLDRSEIYAYITSSNSDGDQGYVRKVNVAGSQHEEGERIFMEEDEDIIGKTN